MTELRAEAQLFRLRRSKSDLQLSESRGSERRTFQTGQRAGGDTRGMQSAAMIIVKKDGGVWLHNDVVLRLQVDDNPQPLKELRRLVEKAGAQRPRGRG